MKTSSTIGQTNGQSGQIKIKPLPISVALKQIPIQQIQEPVQASKSPYQRKSPHFSTGSESEYLNSFSTPEKKTGELKDLQTELDLLNKTHSDLHKNIEELRTSLKLAKKQNDELQFKVEELMQNSQQKDSEIAKLQTDKNKLEEELEAKKEELKNTEKLSVQLERLNKENEVLAGAAEEVDKLKEALAASEDEGNARLVLFSIEIERLHEILMEKLQQNDELEDTLEELTKQQEENMKSITPMSRAKQEKLKSAGFPPESSNITPKDTLPNERNQEDIEELKKSLSDLKNNFDQRLENGIKEAVKGIQNNKDSVYEKLLQEGLVRVLMMIEIDRLQDIIQKLSKETTQLEAQCQTLKDNHAKEMRELLNIQEKAEASNHKIIVSDKLKQDLENSIRDLHEEIGKLKKDLAEKNFEAEDLKSRNILLEKKYYNDLFILQREMELRQKIPKETENTKSDPNSRTELIGKLLNAQKNRIDDLEEITMALQIEMSDAKKEGALRGADAEKWKTKSALLEKKLEIEGISKRSPAKNSRETLSDISREPLEKQLAAYRQLCDTLQDKIANFQEKEQEHIKENFVKEIDMQNLKNRYDVLDHDYRADRERQKGEFEYFLHYYGNSPDLIGKFREFWTKKPIISPSLLSQEEEFTSNPRPEKDALAIHINNNINKTFAPSASSLQDPGKSLMTLKANDSATNYSNREINDSKPSQQDRSGRESQLKYRRDYLEISVSPHQRDAENTGRIPIETRQAYPMTTTVTSTQYKPSAYIKDYGRSKTPTLSDNKNITIPKLYSPEKSATNTLERIVLPEETIKSMNKPTQLTVQQKITNALTEGQPKQAEKPPSLGLTYNNKNSNIMITEYNPIKYSGYLKPTQDHSPQNISQSKLTQTVKALEANQLTRSTERVPYSRSLVLPDTSKEDSSLLVNSQALPFKSPIREAHIETKTASSLLPSRNNRFNSNPQGNSADSATQSTDQLKNPRKIPESFVSENNLLTIPEKQPSPSYYRKPESTRIYTNTSQQPRSDQERPSIRSTANERSISEGPIMNSDQLTQNVSSVYLKKLQETEIRFIITSIELERVMNLLRKDQTNSLYNSIIGLNELQKSQNDWNLEKGALLKQIQAQRINLKDQDAKIRNLFNQQENLQNQVTNLSATENNLRTELDRLRLNLNSGPQKEIMRGLADQGLKLAEENGVLDTQLREEKLKSKDLENKMQYFSRENQRLNDLIQQRDKELEKLQSDSKDHMLQIQDLHSQIAAEENKQQAALAELRRRLDDEKEIDLRQITTKLRGEHQSEIKRIKDDLQQQLIKSPQKDSKIREMQKLAEQLTQSLQERENEIDDLRRKLQALEERHQKEKEDQNNDFNRQLKAKVDSELRRLNDRMSLQKDSMETELQRAEERCQELEKLIQEKNGALDNFANENAAWEREVDKWKRKYEQLERASQLELANLRDDYELNVKNQLQAKINEMSKTFEKERNGFNDTIKRIKTKVSDLELRGVMLMIEIERQDNENERLNLEVEEMRERENETENLYQREVDGIKRQFEAIKARMQAEMDEAEKRFGREYEALEGQIEHLKTRQGELERLIEELNGNNTKLSDELLVTRREKKGLVEKCNIFEDKKNDLENRILKLELEKGRMDRERDQMSNEIESLERALNQAHNDQEKKLAIITNENKQLKEELAHKEDTIKTLREQLDKMKHDIQEYADNLRRETENNQKHETDAAVRAVQEKAHQEIDRINGKLSDTKNDLHESEKQIEKLQQELDKMTQNLNSKLKENEALQDQINVLHKDYKKKLQEQYDLLIDEKEHQVAEALADQESAFEKEKQKLNNQINDLTNQTKHLMNERDARQVQINQLKQNMDKLTLENEKELADLQEKLDKDHSRKIEEIQKDFKNERTTFETKIKELKTKLREAEVSMISLSDEIENLKKTVEEKEREIEVLREELESSRSEKEAAIERLQHELDVSNQNIKNKQKEIEKLRNQISDLTKEHKKKLQEQHDALAEEKEVAVAEALDEQLKVSEKEKLRLANEISDLNSQKQQLISEREGKMGQINELKQAIEKLKEEQAEALLSLRAGLESEAQKKIEEAQKDFKNERTAFETKIKELKLRIRQLETQIIELNATIESLTKQNDERMKEIEELRDELDKLEVEKDNALDLLQSQSDFFRKSSVGIGDYEIRYKAEKSALETQVLELKGKLARAEEANFTLESEIKRLKETTGTSSTLLIKQKELQEKIEDIDKLKKKYEEAVSSINMTPVISMLKMRDSVRTSVIGGGKNSNTRKKSPEAGNIQPTKEPTQ